MARERRHVKSAIAAYVHSGDSNTRRHRRCPEVPPRQTCFFGEALDPENLLITRKKIDTVVGQLDIRSESEHEPLDRPFRTCPDRSLVGCEFHL
jgi:hypothetical protein